MLVSKLTLQMKLKEGKCECLMLVGCNFQGILCILTLPEKCQTPIVWMRRGVNAGRAGLKASV